MTKTPNQNGCVDIASDEMATFTSLTGCSEEPIKTPFVQVRSNRKEGLVGRSQMRCPRRAEEPEGQAFSDLMESETGS